MNTHTKNLLLFTRGTGYFMNPNKLKNQETQLQIIIIIPERKFRRRFGDPNRTGTELSDRAYRLRLNWPGCLELEVEKRKENSSV